MNKKIMVFVTLIGVIILAVVLYNLTSFITKTTGYSIDELKKEKGTVVYYFYYDECKVCGKASIFLDNLENINLKKYNINQKEARILFGVFFESYHLNEKSFPVIFIDNDFFQGWSDDIEIQIKEKINSCSENCENPVFNLNK